MSSSPLKDKVVVITGASSGIGMACAEVFARNGAQLALCARNIDRLDEVAGALEKDSGHGVLFDRVDVRSRVQAETFIHNIAKRFDHIDVLINNAGLALGFEKLGDGLVEDWDTMIDTNIKGLLYITRAALPAVIKSEAGLIINIGSMAAMAAYPNGAVYCASKAAVRLISDGLRQDIVDTPVRVTTIQPGMVETNFSLTRFHGDKAKADAVYKGIQPLTAGDIADVAFYAASVPSHVQICEVTVTPTHQATGGVVYRNPADRSAGE